MAWITRQGPHGPDRMRPDPRRETFSRGTGPHDAGVPAGGLLSARLDQNKPSHSSMSARGEKSSPRPHAHPAVPDRFPVKAPSGDVTRAISQGTKARTTGKRGAGGGSTFSLLLMALMPSLKLVKILSKVVSSSLAPSAGATAGGAGLVRRARAWAYHLGEDRETASRPARFPRDAGESHRARRASLQHPISAGRARTSTSHAQYTIGSDTRVRWRQRPSRPPQTTSRRPSINAVPSWTRCPPLSSSVASSRRGFDAVGKGFPTLSTGTTSRSALAQTPPRPHPASPRDPAPSQTTPPPTAMATSLTRPTRASCSPGTPPWRHRRRP